MRKSFSIILLVLSLIILMIGCKTEKNSNKPVVDLKDLNKKGNNSSTSTVKEDDNGKLKEFTVTIKSNAEDGLTLDKDIRGYLEINNGKFIELNRIDDKYLYELKYKAENELIPDGDEWMYEENHKLNKYQAEVISNLDKEDFEEEVNNSLKYVKGKLLSAEQIEGTKDKWYKYRYVIKYQATRKSFIDEEIVGPIAEIINEKADGPITVSVEVAGGKTSIIVESNRDTKSFKNVLVKLKEIKVLGNAEYKQSEEKNGKFIHTIITEDDKEKALDFLAKYRNFLGDKDTKIARIPNKDKYKWEDVKEALWQNVLSMNSLEMTDFVQEGDDFVFVYKGIDRDPKYLYSLLKKKYNNDKKDKKDNKDNKDDKVEEKEEVKKALNLDDYNAFVSTSYKRVFANWLKTKEDGHLIYSPYSYKKAFEGLGDLTDEFKKDQYIGKVAYSNLTTPPNTQTETITMLNSKYFESDDKRFKVVDFKKKGDLSEAEETSKDLQQRILNEVLLAPDYDESLASVIINATRFYGKWEKPFEKERTEKLDFITLDNKKIKKDIMQAGDLLRIGYEDEMVTAGAKALKSENEDSFVYFISPKKWDDRSLKEVAKNIPNIIGSIHNFNGAGSDSKAKYYDTVFVAVPKMDIESKIALDEVERGNGGEDLFKAFRERNTIKRKEGAVEALQINKITQVATMRMDEEEIEAKAVTEMKMELTAMIPEEETILEIDCTHPHFVVTVSDGIISFIGFVGE